MIRPLPSPWPYPAYKQQEAVPHTFCYKEQDPCEVLTKKNSYLMRISYLQLHLNLLAMCSLYCSN